MNKPLSFVALPIIFLLASCQQRLYFPERANVLGFKEAHEAKLTASFKPQGDDPDQHTPAQISPTIDVAYAPVNHLAVFGSYHKLTNRNIIERENIGKMGGLFNGHRIEGGAGYFTTFANQGRLEILGGYGAGSLDHVGKSFPGRDFSTEYHRTFLQAACGFSSNFISVMGGLRFAYQKFSNFSSDNPSLQYDIANHDDYTGYYQLNTSTPLIEDNYQFLEPFVNIEVGYKYVKLNAQLGTGIQTGGYKIGGNTPVYASFGIVLHYAPRFFKKHAANDDGNWLDG